MRITYDWLPYLGPAPGPGDVLQALRRRGGKPTGTAYLILAAREVRTRRPVLSPEGDRVQRMRYEVGHVTGWDDAVRVESIVWQTRKRRR